MIEFKNVGKEYEDTQALEDASFKINDGEFVFIVGHSGAGKTTVTKLLLREIRPSSGSIEVDGCDVGALDDAHIPYYRRGIGMVFQDFRLFKEKTARENVEFAMKVVGTSRAEIKRRTPALLRLVGMEEKADHFPAQLSGGEQQRVALARAIANNPSIIIADEPTGNVDPQMSAEIMNMLLKINKLGKTVIVVTHEERLVDTLGCRVITIKRGRVASDRPATEVRA